MILYSSDSLDAAQLNNEWGGMNKVINYIIDGGNKLPIVSVESTAINKVKIKFSETVPYTLYQTILLEDAIETQYNGTYFVEEINVVDKYLIAYNKLLSVVLPVELGTVAKVRTKPCGMTKVFGGVADKRTVFKTVSGMHYRIDDRDYAPLLTPPVVFNAGWQKLCRVSMAKSYTSLDSVTERIHPYDASRPTENFMPVGGYIGQNYMIYNSKYIDNTSTSTPNYANSPSEMQKCKYKIYANDSVMYIYILSSGIGASLSYNMNEIHRCYVLGDYTPLVGGLYQPSLLLTNTFSGYKYNDSGGYIYNYDTGTNSLPSFPYYSAGANVNQVIFDNMSNNVGIFVMSGEFSLGSSGASGNNGMSYLNKPNNAFYISDILIYHAGSYFGKMIGIKWVNTAVVNSFVKSSEKIKDGSLVQINGKYYIAAKAASGYAANNVSAFNCMAFIEMDR